MSARSDRQADTIQIMVALNEILEEWIRDKPEQWLWLHRRWPESAHQGEGASGAARGD